MTKKRLQVDINELTMDRLDVLADYLNQTRTGLINLLLSEAIPKKAQEIEKADGISLDLSPEGMKKKYLNLEFQEF